MNREVGLALQAWGVGLLTLAFVVLPGSAALQGLFSDPFFETLLPRVAAFFVMMVPGALMTFTFGILLSFPIFLVGLGAALILRRRIVRDPLVYAALAPPGTVGLLIGVSLLTSLGSTGLMSALREAMLVATRVDSLIVVLPVAAGSLYFCLRLSRLYAEKTRPSVP